MGKMEIGAPPAESKEGHKRAQKGQGPYCRRWVVFSLGDNAYAAPMARSGLSTVDSTPSMKGPPTYHPCAGSTTRWSHRHSMQKYVHNGGRMTLVRSHQASDTGGPKRVLISRKASGSRQIGSAVSTGSTHIISMSITCPVLQTSRPANRIGSA